LAKWTNKFISAMVSNGGQFFLLIFILALAAVLRFALANDQVPLMELSFKSEAAQHIGKVISSRRGGEELIIFHEGSLRMNESPLAQNVVNVYGGQGEHWVKTEEAIVEIDLDSGVGMEKLSGDNVARPSFAQARLVGVKDGRYFLYFADQVEILDENGMVEGPYYLEGWRKPRLLEEDWRRGVALLNGNSWTIYVDFRAQTTVELPLEQGELRDVYLSRDASSVIYVLQLEDQVQLWYAQANGAQAQLIHQGQKWFSSMEVVWSPDQTTVVISVLGYAEDAGPEDEFSSTTLMYRPRGQESIVLNKSQGHEIQAMVPTAWDADEFMLWFNWLHQEQPVPTFYTFFSQ